jgi:hypothetical protein
MQQKGYNFLPRVMIQYHEWEVFLAIQHVVYVCTYECWKPGVVINWSYYLPEAGPLPGDQAEAALPMSRIYKAEYLHNQQMSFVLHSQLNICTVENDDK